MQRDARSGRERDVALVGRELAGQEAKERRLARAVSAHQRDPVAGADDGRDIGQHLVRAVGQSHGGDVHGHPRMIAALGGAVPHLPRRGAQSGCCARCRAAPRRRGRRIRARPPAPPAAASRPGTAASSADARRVARRTLRALADADAVVVPAGSCAAMMRLHWPQLFHGERDQELAERVAARVVRALPVPRRRGRLATAGSGRSAPRSPTTTPATCCASFACTTSRARSCAAVADLRELPRADRCCGFGGTFSVRYPDVSTAMADDKLASAASAGASHGRQAPTRAASCRSRAGRHARAPAVRVVHLATIVAEAL